MIKKMEDAERDTALRVADLMAAAARTAPKASGKDKVVTVIVTGDDMMALADETEKAGKEYGEDFFIRDANNVRNSHCVVVIGVVSVPFGLVNCGMCRFCKLINPAFVCTMRQKCQSESNSSAHLIASRRILMQA